MVVSEQASLRNCSLAIDESTWKTFKSITDPLIFAEGCPMPWSPSFLCVRQDPSIGLRAKDDSQEIIQYPQSSQPLNLLS